MYYTVSFSCVWICGLDWADVISGPVTGFCERGDELLCSVNRGRYIDKLILQSLCDNWFMECVSYYFVEWI
jgi:hypothetical protein